MRPSVRDSLFIEWCMVLTKTISVDRTARRYRRATRSVRGAGSGAPGQPSGGGPGRRRPLQPDHPQQVVRRGRQGERLPNLPPAHESGPGLTRHGLEPSEDLLDAFADPLAQPIPLRPLPAAGPSPIAAMPAMRWRRSRGPAPSGPPVRRGRCGPGSRGCRSDTRA